MSFKCTATDGFAISQVAKQLVTISLPAAWTLGYTPRSEAPLKAFRIPIDRPYLPKREAQTQAITVKHHQ